MHLEVRQDSNCISQCPDVLPCACSADQVCVRINRSCSACAENKCVASDDPAAQSTLANGSSSKSSGGVSKGALAGGIVGALIFFAIAIALFLWYRRRTRLNKPLANHEVKKDIPAPAETVLNRPDPIEKPPSTISESSTYHYTSSSGPTVHSDHGSQQLPSVTHHTTIRSSIQSNPFSDTHSIQTTGTEGTNVIPIALVSPDHAQSTRSSSVGHSSAASSAPVRPARSPELNLNLEHVNVSHDTLRAPNYAFSTISGISAASSRNSFMSGASYSSDFLNEAPMIMTPTKGTVRQVLGVVKAEVIQTPGSAANASSSANDGGLKPPVYQARPSVGSPLAATSFGPADVVKEVDESVESGDPFSDVHSMTGAEYGTSAPPTANSLVSGSSPQGHESAQTELNDLPWARNDDISSRPSSMFTQAGSVIDIGSATRVNVGLSGLSPSVPGIPATSRSQFRTTMGRLVTPPTGSSTGTLQEQQQRALAHAQAQAQAQGLDKNRRISGSSVMSAASTRADSILESFPFVPPSPISDRPIRTPPVSPLSQQSFTAPPPTSPLAQHIFTVAPPSPRPQQDFGGNAKQEDSAAALPAPPDRRTLGLSTASQLSTASSGLGSFPFQIDSGTSSDRPPSAFHGRQRASLDTLALTSDLSSYPLGFDRDSMPPPKKG